MSGASHRTAEPSECGMWNAECGVKSHALTGEAETLEKDKTMPEPDEHSNGIPGDRYIALNLIGQSSSFRQAVRNIRDIARYDLDTYIFGETGAGKELAARAVHYLSQRRDKPLIPVTCGALTDELFLNELFGHIKGAYTGAMESARGLIEAAEGGTLFLDEIDSLSLKAQVALPRFLQERLFRPLGSSHYKKADIRVICASNRDLYALVDKKRFRGDLLYRLDIRRLEIPPLRERRGDVKLLANHFLKKIRLNFNLAIDGLPAGELARMKAYDWPGNVRQLENYMYKLCLTPDQSLSLAPSAGPPGPAAAGLSGGPLKPAGRIGGFNEEKARVIESFEKKYLCKVLAIARGNVSRAAQMAQKERRGFARLLKKHHINRESFHSTLQSPCWNQG